MASRGLNYLIESGAREGVIVACDGTGDRDPLEIMVSPNVYGIDILIKGYGNNFMEDPQAAGIIHIEGGWGGLKVYVWGDPHSEEPTAILRLDKTAIAEVGE